MLVLILYMFLGLVLQWFHTIPLLPLTFLIMLLCIGSFLTTHSFDRLKKCIYHYVFSLFLKY